MSTLRNNRSRRRSILKHTLTVVVLLAALPSLGQIHGIPPSITSFGTGGSYLFAPRPSITSLGPFGWQLPGQPFQYAYGTPGPFNIPFSPLFPVTRPFPFNRPFNGARGGGSQSGALIISNPYPVPYPVPVVGDVAGPDNGEEPVAPPSGLPMATNPSNWIAAPYPPPGPSASNPMPAANPQPAPEQQPTTVLVFRNGKRLEVRNYAIVGDQFVNLSGGGPRRIALSDLDLSATSSVNDERGVSFRFLTNSRDKKQ